MQDAPKPPPSSTPRPHWRATGLLIAVHVLSLCVSRAHGGDALADAVLRARGKDAKEQAAVRARRGGDASSAMAVARRERIDSVVSLVVGMYLETGEFEGAKTLAVLTALASRKGLAGKAATMAAWSPHAEEILKGLLASRSASSLVLAARILAVYSHGQSVGGAVGKPAKARKGKKKGGAKAGLAALDIEPFVGALLRDGPERARELAVLAAAYARLDAVADSVDNVTDAHPDRVGARLFYLARVQWELPEDVTRKLLRARVAVPRRYASLNPLLHSYDIRGHGLLYACQAVAEAADHRFAAEMHDLLDHADLRVQVQAAKAIERIGDPASVPVLLKKLESGPPWPVKVAVLSALGAIPARESIEPLFRLLGSERGRFRQDAAYALTSICPPILKAPPLFWRRWWAENGDDFKVDSEATAQFRKEHRVQDIPVEALAEFYGGKILSDRVVFVLDTSMSMKGDKIKDLKLNMAATLNSLPAHVKFNVVDFGGVVQVMRPGRLIDARHREEARGLVDYMELTLGTRTFDAMEIATLLPEMDTLVYLSDAAPVAGQFEAWPRIVRAFDLYNRWRPVAIYCILYAPKGAKGKGAGRAGGMKDLADHNAGLMSVAGQGN